MNESKSKEIIFDFRKYNPTPHQNIFLNGTKIEIVKETKFLGITLDSVLKFDKHIYELTQKMHKRMFLVKKIQQFKMKKRIVSLVYQSYVQSVLFYSGFLLNSNIWKKLKKKLLSCDTLAIKRGWIQKEKTEKRQKI